MVKLHPVFTGSLLCTKPPCRDGKVVSSFTLEETFIYIDRFGCFFIVISFIFLV